jgi:serine-type D-Ala-D-Ala carboxypeptidase (penicillin-binding protein 5/6)
MLTSAKPTPPAIQAKAYFMLDAATGKVLAQKEEHMRLAPASITKVMTAYIAFDKIRTGEISYADRVVISKKASAMKGSRMFLRAGAEVGLEDILHGVVISSGNDASVALAEHIAGSETAFADLMNEYAAQLGMKNSHFVNATGWPMDDHYTTAHDIAIISTALIQHFPEHYKMFSIESFTYGKSPKGKPITQNNRNQLLKSKTLKVDGIKTGHTEEAGYCLAASAIEEETRLVSVVMGANSSSARALQTQRLLNFGFRNYETVNVVSKNDFLRKGTIWKGEKSEIGTGSLKNQYVTREKNRKRDGEQVALKKTIILDSPLTAPISKGQQVGLIMITQDGELLEEFPLVALEDVAESNVFSQMWDGFLMYFKE